MELVDLDELEATPHAELFEGEPKTNRLSLDAGQGIAAHSHPGREIVFHLLEGELELSLGAETYALSAGDLARFDGERSVSPRAIEDSTALVVLAARGTD